MNVKTEIVLTIKTTQSELASIVVVLQRGIEAATIHDGHTCIGEEFVRTIEGVLGKAD